jgi:hypothetical protein
MEKFDSRRMFVLFTLFLLGTFLTACRGNNLPSTVDQVFTIRAAGDSGQAFTGSYVLLKADGNIISSTIEGNAPRDFRVEGIQVDVTISKASATGYLEAQILKGRKVVAEGSVSSAFGSLTLLGR